MLQVYLTKYIELPQFILKIFDPIFWEMDNLNQSLTLNQFINASCNLYETLCVADKNEILKYNKPKKNSNTSEDLFHVLSYIYN